MPKPTGAYRIRAKIWLYPGPSPWHFVTLSKKTSDHIRSHHGWRRQGKKGWVSFRVQVTLGKTTWSTSLFPSKKTGGYVMPLKESVRKAEGLRVGKTVALALKVS